ncbi:sigma 54-interacting transcriptional regulator [Desulfosporosinus sp. PR]|uniref:sigma 54-interacting transcriptional regulator n=1 Tax=Candidatus Desulfosporosinus nitrosoreducens TaxID=3401928 RepID=UPI0027E67D5F|nr:sigma 54-interacting transcriptional regulator [Desulfosporosinus sp. PR]MDQ7096601.1 sigma 54-interacting transcriptional regulator [Desulfosporosinus sp. PR]
MKRIDAVYKKLKELDQGKGATAGEIADALELSRANVSNDLNLLFQEGKVRKEGTKPIYFRIVPDGGPESEERTLDSFAEKNPSLFAVIEQAKAAVLYPPKGMPIMILGETGTGKSMLAGLIHQYAVEMGKMTGEAPFVLFNCADYANNPQLLISQLFGTMKGAYTGADADKAGLIEKADGGVLFLDEVHRLPPEGQEMFFAFMDRGIFRRLGETDIDRTAQVLIVSATTENPDSALLRTFTRRIPMILRLPSLDERTIEERFNLVSEFMREESSRLGKQIMVSVNSMRAFLSYRCPNNIGQLKTDIQLACAKAYADFVSRKKEEIKVSSMDLQPYIREGLYKETEHRQLYNKFIGFDKRYCIFAKGEKNMLLKEGENEGSIYDMIDLRVHELRSKGLSAEELESRMEKDIADYYRKYLYKVDQSGYLPSIENIVGSEIIRVVEEIIKFSEERLGRAISKKVYYAMAVHIPNSLERLRKNRKIVNPQLNKIRVEYSEEFLVAVDCLKIIDRVFDVSMPIDEAGFLTMFLVYNDQKIAEEKKEVKIIVIAHGTSTASSLAETANRLLGVQYTVGINALLEEKPQQVIVKLKTFLKEEKIKSDLLFLVDMGSLINFGEEIEQEFGINTKTIPLVSTLHVIVATRKAMLGYSLDEVYQETLAVNTYLGDDSPNVNLLEEQTDKLAIVTCCTTGKGSALVLKNILESKLKLDRNIVEIIPVNLVGKEDVQERLKTIGKTHRIMCIISPLGVETKIPQFDFNDVLNLQAIATIQELVEIEVTYYKIGEALENQLANIKARTALKDIKGLIHSIEDGLKVKVDTKVLIGVALHIGCMLDKLLSGGTIVPFESKEQYMAQYPQLYTRVQKACAALADKYRVSITEDEICYIMMFFLPYIE